MRCCIAALLVVSATLAGSAQQPATYTHDKTGVVFTAPEEWTYVQTEHLLDGGDQIQWRVRPSGAIVYAWIIDQESDAAGIDQRLETAVDRKIAQRSSANYRNYEIRQDAVRAVCDVDSIPVDACCGMSSGSASRVVR